MIWKILGLLGGGSFFVVGLGIWTDPNCNSVSFRGGGARTVITTCFADATGDFNKNMAVTGCLIIGLAILTVLFWPGIKLLTSNLSLRIKSLQKSEVSQNLVSTESDDSTQNQPSNSSKVWPENIFKLAKKNKLATLISTILMILLINIFSQNYNSSILIKEIKKNESLMNIFNAANSHNLPKKDPEFNNEFKYGSAVGTLAWDNWFRENIIQVATAAASGIQEKNYIIERLKLLPFDSRNNEARRTYLIHSHFWVDFLTEVRKCSDIQCYLKVDKDAGESIRSSFRIARIAANNSIPLLDLVNARAEIKKIYVS